MTIDALKQEFENRYNKPATQSFFCPGRVNLIGEHIDYNGGQVMPFAISLGTYLFVAPNNDNVFRFQCANFPETAEFAVGDKYRKSGKEWFYYPLGVVDYFTQKQQHLGGLDLFFYGNLPIGSGLSSSASIEVLMAYALSQIFNIGISKKDIALLCKEVENKFIGVNSGIMDQFAVAMGKQNHVILLNCDTVEHIYIPFNASPYKVVIINSNKQRSLAESKYNERYAECMEALAQLKQELNIHQLCDIDFGTFQKYAHLITNPVVGKRAAHVITENDRVKAATVALQSGDMETLGQILYASHESLKNLYEVSGRELDAIVDYCKTYNGCIGARMTGAGFGGCAIALVHEDVADAFAESLTQYYNGVVGYPCEVFTSAISEGVSLLEA